MAVCFLSFFGRVFSFLASVFDRQKINAMMKMIGISLPGERISFTDSNLPVNAFIHKRPRNRKTDDTPEMTASTDTPIYLNAIKVRNEARNVLTVDRMISGCSARIPTGDAPLSPRPASHRMIADKKQKNEAAEYTVSGPMALFFRTTFLLNNSHATHNAIESTANITHILFDPPIFFYYLLK